MTLEPGIHPGISEELYHALPYVNASTLKIVAEGINALRDPEKATLMITHYQRLLDYVVPDKVHVLAQGRIVKTGGKELALELEEKGYAAFDATSKDAA